MDQEKLILFLMCGITIIIFLLVAYLLLKPKSNKIEEQIIQLEELINEVEDNKSKIGNNFEISEVTLGTQEHPGFQISQIKDDGTRKPLVKGNQVEGVTIFGGHASHHDLNVGVYSPLEYGDYSIKYNPSSEAGGLSYTYSGTDDNLTYYSLVNPKHEVKYD